MTSPSSYKFFIEPFATGGDTTTIPVPPQSGGLVSMTEGFTSVYEIADHADPMYQPVPRAQSNWLYYVITQAIKQYQTFGTPEWIDATSNGGTSFPYDKYATVKYTDGNIYLSLVTSNTTTPGTDPTKWRLKNTANKAYPTPQPYTGGGVIYTFTHSLGAIPDVVTINLLCTSNDSGYTAGQTINIASISVGGVTCGVTVLSTTTTIGVVVDATGIEVENGATFGGATIGTSNWTITPMCALL